MKEMHLTPNLWIVSAKSVFLPKIKIWEEEIQFWKEEATQLARLSVLGAVQGKQEDKALIMKIEAQLIDFVKVQIPPVERAIPPLRRVLEGKALGCQFRSIEEKIEHLRKTYYDLKMQLLPFLTKFVSTGIW